VEKREWASQLRMLDRLTVSGSARINNTIRVQNNKRQEVVLAPPASTCEKTTRESCPLESFVDHAARKPETMNSDVSGNPYTDK
jgi:hypothetical protein